MTTYIYVHIYIYTIYTYITVSRIHIKNTIAIVIEAVFAGGKFVTFYR